MHCHFGDDRTDVFTAVYRMAVDKWPADRAIKEMYFFGFNGFWHPAMKSFIRDFTSRLNSSPALSPLRTLSPQPSPAGVLRQAKVGLLAAGPQRSLRRPDVS